jgi:excisionase family DNA binding protein
MDALTVSVAEAAEALGIGETLARELIERGELPSVRVSRRVLVPVQGLRDYVAGLATEQVAGQP